MITTNFFCFLLFHILLSKYVHVDMRFVKVYHLSITCNFCFVHIRRSLGVTRVGRGWSKFFDTFVKTEFLNRFLVWKFFSMVPLNPRNFFLVHVIIKWRCIWWSWTLLHELNRYCTVVDHLHHTQNYASILRGIFQSPFFYNISAVSRNNLSQ